ncbi:hypothetical protein ACFYVR_02395 [Rhodococcus sp. NPDC003318]|uniref:hypothetical protein n=1 Tax=Rhodococcus sp. NPDC003318 TaxID=3364503 RepID=UPI00367FAD79
MVLVRAEWVILAILAVALGVVVAGEPMLEITDCELGRFAVGNPGGVGSPAQCAGSTLAFFRFDLLIALAIPVALCLLAAARPRRVVSWAVAAALAGCVLLAVLSLMQSIGPSTTPVTTVYLYLAPVAAGAVELAALHDRIAAAR